MSLGEDREQPDQLISNPKASYGESFQAHLLEQYKLYVDSSQKVTDRRITTGNYLLTVNSFPTDGFRRRRLTASGRLVAGHRSGCGSSGVFYLVLSGGFLQKPGRRQVQGRSPVGELSSRGSVPL